jgi:NADPH:quinone reductase-like Zn-dependent oxidoreductase
VLALVADHSAPAGLAHRETGEPHTRRNEALVELRASSLNRGEIRRLAGRAEGTIPGWDVAGVVVRQAEDGGPPEGARVVGLVNEGAWAERVAAPIGNLAELPDELSFADAATLPVAGLTALHALRQAGTLLGRRVLITGGAGGVGRFAIQLAQRAGAHVIAVVGDRRRAAGLEELGAHEIYVGFDREGPPVDVVLESAGGESLAAAFQRVAPRGTIVTFGNSSGEETHFNVADFYGRAPGTRVYALQLFSELPRAGSGAGDLGMLADMVARGELKTEVALEVDWSDPDAALQQLMRREVPGKAVLRFGDPG